MKVIDFNENFSDFQEEEDILLDTGIILALLNEYDAWHNTVRGLFENHVFGNDNQLFLYVNPIILNEVSFLSNKPLEQYMKNHPEESFTDKDIRIAKESTVNDVLEMVKHEILLILDGNRESALKQLELYRELGSADAANVSIANEFGTSFLTVDSKLAWNIKKQEDKLNQIGNIYHTTGKHMSY